jgi:glutamine amidotransferase
MICIIDLGIGNFGSVLNILRHMGFRAQVSSDCASLNIASKLIIPGVGSFQRGSEGLEARPQLRDAIYENVLHRRKPILGICLGMQMLFERSEEGFGKGLGLIEGEIVKFDFQNQGTLKVPHIGWGSNILRRNVTGLESLSEGRYYFVHSFYAVPKHSEQIICDSIYGITFASVVGNKNVMGCQFHPEKSHRHGIKFLREFAENDWDA